MSKESKQKALELANGYNDLTLNNDCDPDEIYLREHVLKIIEVASEVPDLSDMYNEIDAEFEKNALAYRAETFHESSRLNGQLVLLEKLCDIGIITLNNIKE